MARDLKQNRFPNAVWRPAKDGFAAFGRRARKAGLCRRGATAVEFGIIFPLFLVMTLGLMEMGRAMWIKASMQYATERTTRYYMVNNTKTTTELVTYADAELDAVGVTYAVTFTATLDTSTDPDTMTVTGSYLFQAITSFIPFPDVTLSAQSSVRKNS